MLQMWPYRYLNKRSIVSLSLVTIVLLITSKVELAFLMLQHIALMALQSCA